MFGAYGTARIDACQKAGFADHERQRGYFPSTLWTRSAAFLALSFFSKLARWKSTVRGLMPSVRPASLAGFSACTNEIAGCGPDVGQFRGSNASDGRSTPSAIGIALRVFPSWRCAADYEGPVRAPSWCL